MLAARVVELGQLLGDRAAALHAAPPDVVDRRPGQGAQVDAPVVIEAGVLCGQHRLGDKGRKLAELDDLALLGPEPPHLAPVGGQHAAGAGEVIEAGDPGREGRNDEQHRSAGREVGGSTQGRHGDDHGQGEGGTGQDPPPRQVADPVPPDRETHLHWWDCWHSG